MNEDTGLETGTTSDAVVQRDSIEVAQERARAAVQDVRLALESLLRSGGRPSVREADLPELWQQRDLALQALGLAVLDCELEEEAPLEPPGAAPAGPGEELAEDEDPTEQVELAVVEPVPVGPPSPPPDDAAVERLGRHFAERRKPALAPAVPQAPQPWMVLADAPLPAKPLDMAGAIREVDMLERELQRLPSSAGTTRMLCGFAVGCIAARARVLQQEWCQPPVETRLLGLFSALTRYVAEAGLPYVVGLKREHTPPAGSWRAEVKQRTARLQGAVYGQSAPPRPAAPVKPARPQKKAQAPAPAAASPEVPAVVLAHTRGRRGLVIGGDNRGHAKARIQAALELKNLDWEPGKKMRKVRAAARRLENGRYDVVIVLQNFISHKVTNMVLPALPDDGEVVCGFVPRGYGVDGVVRALLETLPGSEE